MIFGIFIELFNSMLPISYFIKTDSQVGYTSNSVKTCTCCKIHGSLTEIADIPV